MPTKTIESFRHQPMKGKKYKRQSVIRILKRCSHMCHVYRIFPNIPLGVYQIFKILEGGGVRLLERDLNKR